MKSAVETLPLCVRTVTTNQPSNLCHSKENALCLHFAVTTQTNATQSSYVGIFIFIYVYISINITIY